MLAQLDFRRESDIFSQPSRHAGHIGPHDKTKDRDACVAKHQRHLRPYGQEQPSITPITVSGHDKGLQPYVAPKGNEVHLLAYYSHCTLLTRFMDNRRFTGLVIVHLCPLLKMLDYNLK